MIMIYAFVMYCNLLKGMAVGWPVSSVCTVLHTREINDDIFSNIKYIE